MEFFKEYFFRTIKAIKVDFKGILFEDVEAIKVDLVNNIFPGPSRLYAWIF